MVHAYPIRYLCPTKGFACILKVIIHIFTYNSSDMVAKATHIVKNVPDYSSDINDFTFKPSLFISKKQRLDDTCGGGGNRRQLFLPSSSLKTSLLIQIEYLQHKIYSIITRYILLIHYTIHPCFSRYQILLLYDFL